MHADRTNRIALTLLGLLFLVTGVAGLITSVGGFGTGFSHRTLSDNRVSRYIGDNGHWLWPLGAVLAASIALLALRWLIALLFSGDRAGDLPIKTEDRAAGRTTLRPYALSNALTTEIGSYRGVDSAKARVIGDAYSPQLVIAVTANPSANIAALRHRIETHALAHARHAMNQPDLLIQLDLDVSHSTPQRV
jgi:hypothetical protein